MIGLIVGFIITGLIVGALGRLVVPGRNPIGLLATIGLGIVGAIVGGLIGHAIGVGAVVTFLIAIGVAALLVAMVSGTGRRHRAYL